MTKALGICGYRKVVFVDHIMKDLVRTFECMEIGIPNQLGKQRLHRCVITDHYSVVNPKGCCVGETSPLIHQADRHVDTLNGVVSTTPPYQTDGTMSHKDPARVGPLPFHMKHAHKYGKPIRTERNHLWFT